MMLETIPSSVAEPLLLCGDCAELLQRIPDNSVDAIVIDPPYLYLDTKQKNSSFDIPFDEEKVFSSYKRILKPTGFLLFFGRGTSFYRWNTKVAEKGFVFKEEIVWNKVKPSSPFLPIMRRHELCAMWGASKKSKIRKATIPYTERLGDLSIERAVKKLTSDISKLKANMSNVEFLDDVKLWLEKGIITNRRITPAILAPSRYSDEPISSQANRVFRTMHSGCRDGDVMTCTLEEERNFSNEIEAIPDYIEAVNYGITYHPTQKPTRLLERLINIVTDEGALVLDSFMGSGTTGIACKNINRRFIGMELDERYFDIAKIRITEHKKQTTSLL